jgi:hypothetical protein
VLDGTRVRVLRGFRSPCVLGLENLEIGIESGKLQELKTSRSGEDFEISCTTSSEKPRW